MSTVKERLIVFIHTIKLPVAEFERRIKVSGGYVKNMSKSIQPDKLEIISKEFPTLSLDWLLVGRGPMLREVPPAEAASQQVAAAGSNQVLGAGSISITTTTPPAAPDPDLLSHLLQRLHQQDEIILQQQQQISALIQKLK